MWYKNVGTSFYRFVTVHAFDRQADGQTEWRLQYRALPYVQRKKKKIMEKADARVL